MQQCHTFVFRVKLSVYSPTALRRCAVPEEFPVDLSHDPEASVPRVRPHLPPAFPQSGAAPGGGAPQHVLQTLHLLCAGIQPGGQAGACAHAGPHRQAHHQTRALSTHWGLTHTGGSWGCFNIKWGILSWDLAWSWKLDIHSKNAYITLKFVRQLSRSAVEMPAKFRSDLKTKYGSCAVKT